MLNHESQSSTVTKLLDPGSAANTGAATSAWVDVRGVEGDVKFTAQVGALTGSITWTVEDASDSGGTGVATVTPNEGAFAAGAANQIQKRTVRANSTQGFMRIKGTIVTGPAVVAASLERRPKNF